MAKIIIIGAGLTGLSTAYHLEQAGYYDFQIFEKDFDKQIVAKVTDKNNLEYGRASLEIKAKKGDAKFFDFKFDKRTNMETKSTITIE